MLNGFTRERPSRARRHKLLLDSLEDRLAPAVAGNLYVVGSTLVYNGNFADNNITVSGTDADFALTDTSGTIKSSVPGLPSNGTDSVSGAIPSYIQTIAINGQNGTDVLTVGGTGWTTSRNVILSGTTIDNSAALTAKNVTETATLVTLGATINTNGGGPVAGSVLINGTMAVTAPTTIDTESTLDGSITLNGAVAGSATLELEAGTGGNVTADQAINLGSGAGLFVTGDNVGLHQVVDGTDGTLIAAQQAVNLNGSIVTTGPVQIAANEAGTGVYGFVQVAGNITTTSHTGAPDVAIMVGGSGNATVNDITTGAGGGVLLQTGGAIIDGAGPGALNVNTGAGGTLIAQAGAGGINLDTSVANLSANVSSGNGAGPINISNSGLALTIAPGGVTTSDGNVSVSNNLALTVDGAVTAGGTGSSVTLTTTNPNATNANGYGTLTLDATVGSSGDTVNLDTTGDIVYTAGTVDGTALNIDAGSASDSTAPSGSIGATGHALNVSGPLGTPIVVTATTTNASVSGIYIADSATPLTIAQATAQSGVIKLTTTGTNDLVVTGNVSNGDASAITLSAGQNLLLNSGSVTSGSGNITLTPGASGDASGGLTVASGVNVATGTGGTITVTASTATTTDNIDISGTLAGSGNVTVNGASTAATVTLGVSGTVASGAQLLIDAGGTGVQVLNIGGILASTSSTAIDTGGSTANGAIVNLTGQATAGTTFSVVPAAAANVTENLSGTVKATGNLTIDGASTLGVSVISNTGTLTSTLGTVAVNGGTAGTLLFTNNGTITGTTVTITGSSDAANTLSIGGSVTASGPITINNAGDAVASSIVISGSTSASVTNVDVSAAGDNLVVVPSSSSPFAFTFQSGSTSTLEIDTAIGNIAAADAAFANPISFSVFQGWTKTGTGSVTVTPTVIN